MQIWYLWFGLLNWNEAWYNDLGWSWKVCYTHWKVDGTANIRFYRPHTNLPFWGLCRLFWRRVTPIPLHSGCTWRIVFVCCSRLLNHSNISNELERNTETGEEGESWNISSTFYSSISKTPSPSWNVSLLFVGQMPRSPLPWYEHQDVRTS